jgi:hypothetical protein
LGITSESYQQTESAQQRFGAQASFGAAETGLKLANDGALMERMDHIVEYHRRFGIHNQRHLLRSIDILRANGYTDRDLVDMYSVLQNRPFQGVEEIAAGCAISAGA